MTKAQLLPEGGDMRGEIAQMKHVNKQLKCNQRPISDDDMREALLNYLPPSWSRWVEIVERENVSVDVVY